MCVHIDMQLIMWKLHMQYILLDTYNKEVPENQTCCLLSAKVRYLV